MSTIFRNLYVNLPSFLQLVNMSDSSDTSAGDYQPSPFDVIAVKTMFLKRYSLPNELLDAIIDFAEYWPHTTSKMASETLVRSGSDHENKMLVRNSFLSKLYAK